MTVNIDFQSARRLVCQYLTNQERKMASFGSMLPSRASSPEVHLVITDVVEHDFGWVFFWDSKEVC
ncbi:MAG TPA: hypothetical protein VEI49_13225 [Terriglobales bacterium]|nr:hypothetical protein [Terriglobales bacterium]